MFKIFQRIMILSFLLLIQFSSKSQSFTEVSRDIGIDIVYKDIIYMGGGCAFFDYDNDGFEDVFITGGRAQSGLYHNNGDGTFANQIENSGIIQDDTLVFTGIAIGDINNDGCKDMFITTMLEDDYLDTHSPNLLFINNCDGTFTDITVAAGISEDLNFGLGAVMGDVNLDGWLDIYTINYIEDINVTEDEEGNGWFDHTPQDNQLYINNGDNTFTESGASYGVGDYGCSLAAAFTDYDEDGDVDLFVSNDFGYFIEPSSFYQNEYPNSNFTDVGDDTGINTQIYGMGIAIGDYDEDGDLDYYECNFGRNVLHQNQGDLTFVDKATETGTENTWIIYNSTTTVSWATFFADFENNTYLDLFVANGVIPSGSPAPDSDPNNYDAFFYNNGDGTFTNKANILGLNSEWVTRGAAFSDFDNDGDLDYATVVLDEFGHLYDTIDNPLRTLFYRNDTDNGNNWVSFELQGTSIIRDAYGSRVELYADGRKFIREVDGGSSHCSHNTSKIHFGLGSISEIDSVRFMWLGGGAEIYENVELNQQHTIIQGEGISVGTNAFFENFSFNAFPTIFDHQINVEINTPESIKTSIYLYDNKGSMIKDFGKHHLLEKENILHFNYLQDLPVGIYYLKMDVGGKVKSTKLVKQ